MIFGGSSPYESRCHSKAVEWEVNLPASPITVKPSRWSKTVISFSKEDCYIPSTRLGRFPIVVEPTINNCKVNQVLIDGGSASASEVLTGALRDYELATIVGTKSFGKGVVQQLINLKGDKGGLKVTTSKYYTPNGENIHKIGITPDIEVTIPEETLNQEYDKSLDTQLIKSIEVIKEKLK